MSISHKKAPIVTDPQVNRAFQKIYDDMNALIDAVNQGDTNLLKKLTQGKSGGIRLTKDSTDNNYYLEGRTLDGWVRTAALTFIER
jgi:hypothetical protein